MNFFNGPKVRNSLNQYYIYTRKHPLLKNLLTLIDYNLGYTVFQEIEKVKIELTTLEKSTFHYSKHEIEINDSVTKNEYNEIIKSDVERLSKALTKFLQTNCISITEIDTVFLTGGSSLVEEIQKLCQQLFPKINIQTGDHFLSVAKGLAFSEYLLENAEQL